MLSPEDIDWADSCLSKDPEISDNGWNLNSLTDALSETSTRQNKFSLSDKDHYMAQAPVDLDNLPKVDPVDGGNSVKAAINSTTVTSNGSETNTDDPLDRENNANDFWSSHKIEDIFLPTHNENSSNLGMLDEEKGFSFQTIDLDQLRNSVKAAINSTTFTGDATETNSDDPLVHDHNADDFWSSHKIEDIFLPTYNENSRDLGLLDEETGFAFQTFDSDPLAEDIFKTWDLNLPAKEEDDLVKQLNEALGEFSLKPISSVSDDNEAKAWKDLAGESLDELISGIADLTLSSNSG